MEWALALFMQQLASAYLFIFFIFISLSPLDTFSLLIVLYYFNELNKIKKEEEEDGVIG